MADYHLTFTLDEIEIAEVQEIADKPKKANSKKEADKKKELKEEKEKLHPIKFLGVTWYFIADKKVWFDNRD